MKTEYAIICEKQNLHKELNDLIDKNSSLGQRLEKNKKDILIYQSKIEILEYILSEDTIESKNDYVKNPSKEN
jgi:hypothetical protein